jgi:hypothetical protein
MSRFDDAHRGGIYRMAQASEIVAVMGEYNGKPIVRRIGWRELET